jgi:hypothetical protein
MATRWLSGLCAAAVIVCGTSVHGQIAVLPLVDAADPIKLSDAAFDGADQQRPSITVRLENTTTEPLSTNGIWLSFMRFYTPDEARQHPDQVIWNCGLMTRANQHQPTRLIQPGTSVEVKMALSAGCVLNLQHEHFSVGVSRVSREGRFDEFVWKREGADLSRLLQAAMSKVH